MATVTSFTKERILAIEAATIVDGTVDGSGHLILTRHDETTIDAGSVVGPTGPTGPAVGAGSIGYNELTPSQRWMPGDFKWSMQSGDHAGWLKMDGRNNFPRTGGTYDNLFAVVGTSLGAGVDANTFGIGDVSKRVPIGKSATGVNSTLGGTGGSADAVLVGHGHTINNHTHSGTAVAEAEQHTHDLSNHYHFVNTPAAGGHSHDSTSGATNVIGTAGGPYNVNGSGSNWVTFDVAHSIRTSVDGGHEHDVNSDGPSNNTSGGRSATHTHAMTTGNPSDRGTDAPGVAATDKNLPPFIVMNGFIHL